MGTVLVDTSGNPWRVAATGGALTLPVTVVGVQNTGNQAYPLLFKRIRWYSPNAAAGDQAIIKDVPGIGGTATARVQEEFVASGSQQDGVDEARPRAKELMVGMQVTTLDSGELLFYY